MFGLLSQAHFDAQIAILKDKLGIAFRDTNNNIQVQSSILNSTINFAVQYLANWLSGISAKDKQYYESLVQIIQQQTGGDFSQIIGKLDNAAFSINTNIINSTNQVKSELKQTEARIVSVIGAQTDKIGNALQSNFNTVNAKLDNIYAATKIDINALQNFIASQNNNAINTLKTNQETTKDKLYAQIAANQELVKQKLIETQAITESKLKAQILDIGSEITKAKLELQQSIKDDDSAKEIAEIIAQIPNPIDFLNVIIDALSGIPESVVQSFGEFREIVEGLQRGKFATYESFIKALDSLGGSGQVLNTMFNLGKIIWLSVFGTISAFQPFVNNIVTLARSDARDNRLSIEQMLRYFHAVDQRVEPFEAMAIELGYRDEDLDKLRQASFALLSPEIIRFLWLNKQIPENMHDLFLRKLGFDYGVIELIKKTYMFTPPVQDLIVMAVREAFTPEVANLFGQYEGYPTVITEYMARHGVSEEWSKAYWASHWRLPSPEQGFEMFHRGIIDEQTLKLLLRALDVMPFWRDKLINLNYSVLRLVDIRRFYELGVINDEQMYTEYLARGYNPERAEWASTWTKLQASQGTEQEQAERRLLTQSVIIKSLNSGRITSEQAILMLQELRYTRSDAELIISVYQTQEELEREDSVIDDNKKRLIKLATDGYSNRLINRNEAQDILVSAGYSEIQGNLELDWHDYEIETQIKAHIVSWYKELYVTWKIDIEQFKIALSEYGFEQSEVNRLLAEFDVLRETRTRTPTFEMIRRWFRAGIINEEQYVNELKGQGYDDKYIAYFMTEEIQQ